MEEDLGQEEQPLFKSQAVRRVLGKTEPISLRDRIVLGPIDRYKKYNHFPWKLLIHILLVALVPSTMFCFVINYFTAVYGYFIASTFTTSTRTCSVAIPIT